MLEKLRGRLSRYTRAWRDTCEVLPFNFEVQEHEKSEGNGTFQLIDELVIKPRSRSLRRLMREGAAHVMTSLDLV